MENNYTLDETRLKKFTEEVIQVLLKKNEDYGGASFVWVLMGIWFTYGTK